MKKKLVFLNTYASKIYIKFQKIKIMEINKPDSGVFKGIGKLQTDQHINRKFFPNLRNQHRFQFTHQHANEYKTTLSAFNRHVNPKQYLYEKVKKNPNDSKVVFGIGSKKVPDSWNKSVFRKNDFTLPPKQIRQQEEGIGINEYEKLTGQKIAYSTTSQEVFSQVRKKDPRLEVKYKYTRTDRFNPITGESKGNTSFGFEDYAPQNNTKYKANNFSLIPFGGQKYDIISGRRLTYG